MLRSVKVYMWVDGLCNSKKLIYTGKFHRWSQEHTDYCQYGPGHYTVAIVEKPDGTVDKVETELVQFVD